MIKCVTSIQEMSEKFTWRSRMNLPREAGRIYQEKPEEFTAHAVSK